MTKINFYRLQNHSLFCILTSLLLHTSPVVAATETPSILTLKSAIKMAQDKNPAILESHEKIHQLEAVVPQTRALILPNLSVIGTESSTKDAVGLGTAHFGGSAYNQYKADIKLTQPLFQYGTFAAIDSVKKDVQVQTISSEIATRDLTKNIILAYYNIVLNSYSVDTLVKQQKIVKESLATAEKRERSGRGQLLDVLQVKTQIALLQSQIEAARNLLQISVATLENLVGDPNIKILQIKESLEAPLIEQVDKSLNLQNFRLPELVKNEISMSQLSDQKNVVLGQSLPTLNFTGDIIYNSYTSSDLFDDMSRSYNLGIQLTIPLFSGFSSLYQRQSINSQYVQLEFERVNLVNQSTLQQITSRKNLESARDSIISGENALRLAQASIDEARKKYIFGTIDFLQFLQVEQSFIQATFSLYSSKYSYITALANYYSSWGQDLNQLADILERDNSHE